MLWSRAQPSKNCYFRVATPWRLDFAQLAAGTSITHMSTDGNSRTHSFTISCA